ncbi:MAG: cyanophycinase [Mariniblastus sp.]
MRTRFIASQLLIGLFVAFQIFTSVQNTVGQTFDEQFELWPTDLKIGGTVIAGGGGELPEFAREYFMRSASTGDQKTIAIVFEGAMSWSAERLEEEFSGLKNCEIVSNPVTGDQASEALLKKIAQAGAVWIAADKAVARSQFNSLLRCIESAKSTVATGGIVCVNGPASELLGKFDWETGPAKVTGSAGFTVSIRSATNLIPDAAILSGYNDSKDRREILGLLGHEPRCVGIGIEKETAIILRGRKIRVVGEGESTFCLMGNEQKPLRIQHVRQSVSRRPNPYTTIVDLTAWRRDAIERTVDPFPAATPPKPVVENGTLIIVGGGGMPAGLMEQMVSLAGGKEAKMVYVPCSEADEVGEKQRMVEVWKRMGVKSACFIHTKDRNKANSDEDFLAPLKDATGIWFGGGRQWNFSDSYYGTKAHRLMKDVLKRGGVIGGSSAGASIQAAYMCRANPVANFDIMAPGYERGLGFIRGIAIDQHFSQRGRQKDMTQLVDTYPQLLGVGIDETTAIIVNKSLAKVVGKNKVHFYDRTQPVVPDTDDFLAITEGMVFDLAKRVVVEQDNEDKKAGNDE